MAMDYSHANGIFFKKKSIYLLRVHVFLPTYKYTVCVHGAHGGQKRESDPPEWELGKSVNCHVLGPET